MRSKRFDSCAIGQFWVQQRQKESARKSLSDRGGMGGRRKAEIAAGPSVFMYKEGFAFQLLRGM